MARVSGGVAALLRAFDRSRYIDAQSEISGLHGLQMALGRGAVVEDGCDSRESVDAIDHSSEIRAQVAFPVRRRVQVTRRPQRAAVQCITEVHRGELQCDLEKTLQLGHAALIVLALAWYGEYDVIIAEALRRSIAVQRVRHAGSWVRFVMRP